MTKGSFCFSVPLSICRLKGLDWRIHFIYMIIGLAWRWSWGMIWKQLVMFGKAFLKRGFHGLINFSTRVMLPFIYPYIIFITDFCSGTIFEFWKGYLDMEIRLGKTNEARSIYKRCYSKKLSGNGSEVPFEIVYCGDILLLLALVALVFIILIR